MGGEDDGLKAATAIALAAGREVEGARLERMFTPLQFLEADKAKKEAARALKPTFLNTVIHDHDGRADSPTSVGALPPTDEEREPNSN